MSEPSNQAMSELVLTKAIGRIAHQLESNQRLRDAQLPSDGDDAELGSELEHMMVPTIQETVQDGGALGMLCQNFNLTAFERDLLVLCAGVGLEPRIANLVLEHRGNVSFEPTFMMALSTLAYHPGSGEVLSLLESSAAFTQGAALRQYQLLHFTNLTETDRHLRGLMIDERTLDYLLGLPSFPKALRLIRIVKADAAAVPESLMAQVRVASQAWLSAASDADAPLVHLVNPGGAVAVDGKLAVAAKIAAARGFRDSLRVLDAAELPSDLMHLDGLVRLWNRELLFERSVLIVDASGVDSDAAKLELMDRFVRGVTGMVMVLTREPRAFGSRSVVTVEVQKPSIREQMKLWERAWHAELQAAQQATGGDAGQLRNLAAAVDAGLERLANQFDLDASSIAAAVTSARFELQTWSVEAMVASSWRALQNFTRPKMGNLAQVVTPKVSWNQLILADSETQLLHMLVAHTKERFNVYQGWGWAGDGSRGLGVSALFGGPSGTGKTLAAEVIAHELQLDLIKIDLSSVVNKYIGETEKNLGRVFDAAENGGAILFFDEGDALFGKRGEVSDSTDRYANIEVAYLLQRMESFRGLAILTTNLENSLDEAFLRRLRFVVRFAIPERHLRKRIWQSVFPQNTPLNDDVDFDTLSRLEISGGNIRNIALSAALTASSQQSSIRMRHLLLSAESEVRKLKRLLREQETIGWSHSKFHFD